MPSTFPEDLSHSSFDNVYEYPVSTATEKAVEVYERLVVSQHSHIPHIMRSHSFVSQREQPEDGPDLVIGG